MNPKPLISCRKSFILTLILLILSFFFVTPLMIYKIAFKDLSEDDGSALEKAAASYLPLFILVIVNVVVVPFFVDVVAMIEDNETKSSMQKKIMYMNLILMHVNMIILPLAGLVTYE